MPDSDRVVVVLDPHRPTRAAVALAAAIARAGETRVEGVYIEDINVMRLGGLPEAREITIHRGQVRVPDPAQLERELRVLERAVREVFETAAAAYGLAHRFAVLRGPLLAELSRFAAGARMVIFGRSQPLFGRSWWDVALADLLASSLGDLAFVPDEVPARDGVVAFLDIEAAGSRVAEIADAIAARTGVGRLLPLRRDAQRAPAGGIAAGGVGPRIRFLVIPGRVLEVAEVRACLGRADRTVVVVR
jgi:hypothetical protein